MRIVELGGDKTVGGKWCGSGRWVCAMPGPKARCLVARTKVPADLNEAERGLVTVAGKRRFHLGRTPVLDLDTSTRSTVPYLERWSGVICPPLWPGGRNPWFLGVDGSVLEACSWIALGDFER
jgi:hypothetical protein